MDIKKIREEMNSLIADYGKAMRTETEQYPEWIVADKILRLLADKGLAIPSTRIGSNKFIYLKDLIDEVIT